VSKLDHVADQRLAELAQLNAQKTVDARTGSSASRVEEAFSEILRPVIDELAIAMRADLEI
jgi:hypothetical protein